MEDFFDSSAPCRIIDRLGCEHSSSIEILDGEINMTLEVGIDDLGGEMSDLGYEQRWSIDGLGYEHRSSN